MLSAVVFLSSPGRALERSRNLDQFSYQSWQTGSGLPQNTVHQILQTRDGFLWLATDGGLVRFDGYAFKVFDAHSAPALGSDLVQAFAEDGAGALWIATAEGLCREKEGHFERIYSSAPGEMAGIVALRARPGGEIWAVTPHALLRWNSTHRAAPQIVDVPADSGALTGALAEAANGLVLLGTNTGLAMVRDGKYEARAIPMLGAVRSLLVDGTGRLWVAAAQGVFITDKPETEAFRMVRPERAGAASLSLFEDREQTVWLGTEDGLARCLASRAAKPVFDEARALPGTSVIALFEDAEGDLWTGAESAGVTVIRNQKFVTYGVREGLAGDSVRCVFENRSGQNRAGENHPGTLWIGTDEGLSRFENGRFRSWRTADGLSSDVVLSLGADAANELMIGTPDGLNRMRGESAFSVLTSADGLADDFVRSLYRDRDGSLWIGTRRGLSHQAVNGPFTTYTQANGLGSDLVGSVLRDRHGRLWAGTLGGLSRLEGTRFRTFRRADGLSSEVITSLYEDAAGELWIGTGDAGLNVWIDGALHSLPKTLDLPQSIFGIGEDADGQLWLASKSGIARVARGDLRAVALGGDARRASVIWYGTSDGLRIADCSSGGHPALWRQADGTLWFATRKGVAALGAGAARLNRVPPPVTIESVKVDDRPMEPAQLTRVPAGYSRLAIEYAGLSFAAPQKVTYRYQLESFDKAWVEAGTQRIAYYTNLPPGRYRFRVLARNNDGFWSASAAALTLRLAPRFYQTAWFYLLLALAGAAAVYGVYRWRVREVEARWGAVLQERNRIAREIHDTLAQGLAGISMQLETISRLLPPALAEVRDHLDQARLQVRDGLAEARRSIWQLRSQAAGHRDLATRLSQSAQQAAAHSTARVSLEVHGTYRPLRPEVEEELLKIGQEAVTNALRHGAPERVAIELEYSAAILRMTISDDGRGFDVAVDPRERNGHYGLQGMKERAQQIKAGFEVESAAGRGTKISVEAPLNT